MNDKILKTRFWELDGCLVHLSYEIEPSMGSNSYWVASEELRNIRQILFYYDKNFDIND